MSDKDPNFTSDFWTQVFKKLETTLSMSSKDHPQSYEQTKRVNHIIEDMLMPLSSLLNENNIFLLWGFL